MAEVVWADQSILLHQQEHLTRREMICIVERASHKSEKEQFIRIMADLKEDKIDFSKLERELSVAIEADASYWRENDAKLRAMEQRVESYDQFKDMVAAAHIRPLDKQDKIGQGKRQQPWNPYSNSAAGAPSSLQTSELPSTSAEVKVLPKNGHDFAKEWRKRKKSPGQCYSYLLYLGSKDLGRIFKSEISFGLLGEIITTLNEDGVARDCGKVAAVLLCLSQAGRFGLSLDFLSATEKQSLKSLVGKLAQWREQDTSSEGRREGDGGDVYEEGNTGEGKEGGSGSGNTGHSTEIQVSESDIEKLRTLYKVDQ